MRSAECLGSRVEVGQPPCRPGPSLGIHAARLVLVAAGILGAWHPTPEGGATGHVQCPAQPCELEWQALAENATGWREVARTGCVPDAVIEVELAGVPPRSALRARCRNSAGTSRWSNVRLLSRPVCWAKGQTPDMVGIQRCRRFVREAREELVR